MNLSPPHGFAVIFQFVETMMFKYQESAKESGVSIVPVCGFDSIPSEFAVVYAKKKLMASGVTPSAIELFFKAKDSGVSSPQGNFGTFETLIHSISSIENLQKLRQQVHSYAFIMRNYILLQFVRPKIPTIGPKIKLNPWPHWEPRVGSYVIPFFFADPTIVRISQQLVEEGLWSRKAIKPPPVQFIAYIMLPNLLSALGMLAWLVFISIVARFGPTRRLALKHPRLFSFGVFSRHGPTEEHLKNAGFTSTVFASGYSKKKTPSPQSEPGIEHKQFLYQITIITYIPRLFTAFYS
jgi:hypothetical protein